MKKVKKILLKGINPGLGYAFPKPTKQVKEKKRIPRKGKTERSKLIAALDKEMSRIVIARDKACVQCGTTKNLTNGHLFEKGRGASILRWDFRNCFCQCVGHNFAHVRNKWPYYEWYIEKYGQEMFDTLRRDWKKTANYSLVELRELLENLKQN